MPGEMKEVQSSYNCNPSRIIMTQRHNWRCGTTGELSASHAADSTRAIKRWLDSVAEYCWTARLLGGLAPRKVFRVARVLVSRNAEKSGKFARLRLWRRYRCKRQHGHVICCATKFEGRLLIGNNQAKLPLTTLLQFILNNRICWSYL